MRVPIFYVAVVLSVSALGAGCGEGMPQVRESAIAYAQETTKAPAPAKTEPVAPASPIPAEDAPPAPAESSSTPAPPPADAQPSESDLEQLKSQLKDLAERKDAAVPGPSPGSKPAGPDDVEALRTEVASLKKEVSRLQETVDAALAYLVGELGDENRKLKKDIVLPQPDGQPDAEVPTVAPEAPQEVPQPVAVPQAHVDYGELGYLAIKEWGRTPDEAKKLGGNISSLRGMICAVTPNATDDDLKVVAKKLRATCVGFDNVNIDVFDDEAAAHDFADHNTRSSQHYVMSLIRHKQTGKDATILVRANGTREIAVE